MAIITNIVNSVLASATLKVILTPFSEKRRYSRRLAILRSVVLKMKYAAATVNGVISAPRETLFGIVSDVTRHPQMAGSGEVQRVEWVTPPPHTQVGSKFKSVQKIGLEYPMKSVVAVYEPNMAFVWFSGRTGAPPFGEYWGFEFESLGPNKTRVYHGMCVPIPLPALFPFTLVADQGALHEVGNMKPTFQKLAALAGGELEGELEVELAPLCSLVPILKVTGAPCGSVVRA
jgi:hypothetical protein